MRNSFFFRADLNDAVKVKTWLATKAGQGRVMDEVKRLKAAKTFRIGTIDASIVTLKARVSLLYATSGFIVRVRKLFRFLFFAL